MKMRIMFTPPKHITAVSNVERASERERVGAREKEEKLVRQKKWFRRFFSRGYFYLIQKCMRRKME
jgi:hypothetical protein